MASKRPSAIELARAGSSQVERMAAGSMPEEKAPVQITPAEESTAEIIKATERSVIGPESETIVIAPEVAVASDPATAPLDTEVEDPVAPEDRLYRLPLESVRVGGINTRVIDEESRAFKELVASMVADGQLEPVLVGIDDGGYRLIAGERRFRALRAAGIPTVLARVTTAPRTEWSSLMLIENLMRQDLSVWEEASGYKALLAMGLTQEQVGERVHKGKTHVSLVLKIMRNPTLVAAVEEGTITSQSMAKELGALLTDDGHEVIPGAMEKALEFIVMRGPTVHQLRAWIRTLRLGLQDGKAARPSRSTRRGTFLKTEQLRLDAVLQKSAEMSAMEVAMLAKIYEEHARQLREVSQTIEQVVLPESNEG